MLVILGARQVGKSTLAELAFPSFERIDLERPRDFDRLSRDPEFMLGQHTRWVIDEAQRFPELFPVLRSFLDRHPRHRVVLLGSASPQLVKQVSESLTGRLAVLALGGMSILEADAERGSASKEAPIVEPEGRFSRTRRAYHRASAEA